MNATTTKLLSALPLLLIFTAVTVADGQAPAASPIAAACGAQPANFVVSHDAGQSGSPQVPPGKAMVYVIEKMTDYPVITKKVNIGLDGTWLGATDAESFINFTVDAGSHHLCAVYQGKAAGMDSEGRTLLLHLTAEAGKTYYIRYHAFFTEGTPGIAFFDVVDEDEGLLLVQRSQHATSVLKK